MPKDILNELLSRSEDKKKYIKPFRMQGINIYSGSEFEEWLADITAFVSQLKTGPLTQKILELAESFGGWSDEKNFEILTATLRSLYKNYDRFFSIVENNIEENSLMVKNKVFVVHGRNEIIKKAMFAFLRSIGVDPMEWGEVKKLTGKPFPYIGEILNAAFSNAQAIVVLLTPDDEAKLRDKFICAGDDEDEKNLTPQARPNVLFEAGMALGKMEERTIIIEFGKMRKFSDIAGRYIIKFTDTPQKRQDIIDHLKTANVEINIEGKTDWINAGDFPPIE